MRTLNYWVSECLHDSDMYNLRAKSKKEIVQLLTKQGFKPNRKLKTYENLTSYKYVTRSVYCWPRRVTIHYVDAFDLLQQCGNDCGFFWEKGF